MTFTYGFGVKWNLTLVLEDIDMEKYIAEPVLPDVHGKPPEQSTPLGGMRPGGRLNTCSMSFRFPSGSSV